jgi:hypothetical protein
VTGDRNWKDYSVIYRELSKYPPGTIIFHGTYRGADSLADIAAERLGFKAVSFKPEWHIYGRAAGPIRNQKMLDRLLKEEEPKKVLAFHKNLAESTGTKDMVNRALKAGVDVEIIDG